MVSVAQLVERRIVIPVVAGSNPVVHPTQTLLLHGRIGLAHPGVYAPGASVALFVVRNVSFLALGFRYNGRLTNYSARVAELVDALVLGTSVFDVGVRVSPFAPVFVPPTGTSHNQDVTAPVSPVIMERCSGLHPGY